MAVLAKAELDDITDISKERFSKSTYAVISILFFFLGIVRILPWNFFVTANEYWMYKFRNTSIDYVNSDSRTTLQTQFSPGLTISLTISDIAFLVLCMFFGYKFKVRTRIVGSLLVILVFFVILAMFIKINTDTWQVGFFAITMLFVAGINAMNSIFGMSLYTMLSNFPEEYLAPYLIGQGLAGILSSLLQILSLATGMSPEANAVVYFCLGIFVNALALILLVATRNNAFYLETMREFTEGQQEKVITLKEGVHVFKKMWPSLAVMTLWILTVMPVHTAITSLVVSEGEGNGEWNDVYFVPTCTFLLPAIGDLIGRTLASKFKFNLGGLWLTAFSGIRMFIFVPLFMLCNALPRENFPVIFDHDYQYVLIMIFFSITNGYLMSTCSFIIPRLVNPEELNNAYQLYMVGSGALLGLFSFLPIVSVKLL